MRPNEFSRIHSLIGAMLSELSESPHTGLRINSCSPKSCRSTCNPKHVYNTTQQPEYRTPVSDMFETSKEVVVTIEIPGVNKQDIKVNQLEDGIEVKVEKDKKKFYNVFRLSRNADKEKINATYINGVLELKIPKKEKVKREIKVN